MGLLVNGLVYNRIPTGNMVSSLPPNGSLFRFFLGVEMGRKIPGGSAQDIGGKEGTNQFQ